jgi:hypothetical protein
MQRVMIKLAATAMAMAVAVRAIATIVAIAAVVTTVMMPMIVKEMSPTVILTNAAPKQNKAEVHGSCYTESSDWSIHSKVNKRYAR